MLEELFLFFSNIYRRAVSARILASLGSVLVHYFSANMLFYLSFAFLISSPSVTYIPVSQSSLVLSMKLLRVELVADNISLKICQNNSDDVLLYQS